MNWGCICFDLDNTLLDYEAAFEKGMKKTFHHFFDGPWSSQKRIDVNLWFPIFKKLSDKLWDDVKTKKYTKKEYREKRLIQSLNYFGMTADTNMTSQFQNYFYSVVPSFVEPMEDVELLLDELKNNNVKIGIITNGKKSIQNKKIKNIGLDKWFSNHHIFISEEYKAAKPQPLLFQIAREKLNDTALPSLYIGDSWELDIIGSVNAGWDAIYFNSRNEKSTTRHQPIGICHTMKELMDLLEL